MQRAPAPEEAGLGGAGRGGRGGRGGAQQLLEGVLGGARVGVVQRHRLRPRHAPARALLRQHVQRRAPRPALAGHCRVLHYVSSR